MPLTLITSSSSLIQFWQSLSDIIVIKWGGLFLLCLTLVIVTTLSHQRERKYYQRLVSHATNADTAALDYGLRLLSQSARNYFLFSLSFIVLMFCVIFYDIKQHHGSEVTSLRQDVAACERKAEDTAPAPVQDTAPIGLISARELEADEESALDELKRQYEKAYVNFYLLYRCGQSTPEELSLLNAALALEASRFQQAEDFAPLVRDAAIGTYQELYQTFDCASPDLATAHASHARQVEHARESLAQYSRKTPTEPFIDGNSEQNPPQSETNQPTEIHQEDPQEPAASPSPDEKK